MKKFFKRWTTLGIFLASCSIYAQNVVTGSVLNDKGEAIAGAKVTISGIGTTTETDALGNFSIDAPSGSQMLLIEFLNEVKEETIEVADGGTDVGPLVITSSLVDNNSMKEVIVIGGKVSAIVKERETPVAVTTLKAAEIQAKIGNQEFPSIAKTTPSVYFSNSGGGRGDSRIAIRGFAQNNIAVIVNGQPVNDMENGTVYWSNWSGLADIASAVQIQRGLGASKLVVPSVGGTFNVITKATDNKAGGLIKVDVGNDRYYRTTASFSTGMSEKGWGATFLLSKWADDGYAEGTKGAGYTWFASVGYKPSDRHTFNLSATGAPQWHDTRRSSATGARGITLSMLEKYGHKYNSQFGYLNGEEMTTSPNFYHKPIATFNWDWSITDKLDLTTILYGSWGRGGGGSGLNGRLPSTGSGTSAQAFNFYNAQGHIDYDLIQAYNTGQKVTDYSGNTYQKTAYSGGTGNAAFFNGKYVYTGNNGLYRQQGINSHDWYGSIVDLNYKANDHWNISGGIDYRQYKGIHYAVITDLLGLDAVYSTSDRNYTGQFITKEVNVSPIIKVKDNQKISYDNDGHVRWIGTYGQIEYTSPKFSAFMQASGSNQAYKRVDRFLYTNYEGKQETKWRDKFGYIIKTGANYNINDHHNVFFNVGKISRQPYFNALYPSNNNAYKYDTGNENILSFELGYGFRSKMIDANINLYNTEWKNRFNRFTYTTSATSPLPNTSVSAFIQGLNQLHRGAEFDLTARPIKGLKLKGMFSYGDWQYKDNASFQAYTTSDNTLIEGEGGKIYVDGLKVGDAAQMTANVGFDYLVWKGLSFDGSWNYASNLYASLNPSDFKTIENHDLGIVELPDFHLFDAGVAYKHKFEDRKELLFRLSMYNVLDTEYISELTTNQHIDTNTTETVDGIDARNNGFFGLGRTWTATVSFKF